jgi:uncharacterized protein (DUF4415 family)
MNLHKWSELEDKMPSEARAEVAVLVAKEQAKIDAEKSRRALEAQNNTVTLHLDPEVYQWYLSQGDDYEAQINAALRREMEYA